MRRAREGVCRLTESNRVVRGSAVELCVGEGKGRKATWRRGREELPCVIPSTPSNFCLEAWKALGVGWKKPILFLTGLSCFGSALLRLPRRRFTLSPWGCLSGR